MAELTEKDKYAALCLTKQDIEYFRDDKDSYISTLIDAAKSDIEREGIGIEAGNSSHLHVLAMYAAWYYRKRKGDNTGMPRMLRYALNNLKVEKDGKPDV